MDKLVVLFMIVPRKPEETCEASGGILLLYYVAIVSLVCLVHIV